MVFYLEFEVLLFVALDDIIVKKIGGDNLNYTDTLKYIHSLGNFSACHVRQSYRCFEEIG